VPQCHRRLEPGAGGARLAQVQALTYHSGSPVSNEIGVRDRDAGEQSAVPLAGEKDIEVIGAAEN